MVALPLSMAASRPSMSSESFVRVILFFPISVSQKPSCWASWLASSKRRVIMASIIDFTLAKGSAMTFSASITSLWLFRRWPSCSRNSRILRCTPPARRDRACAREAPLRCGKARYFSALPETSLEDRISMAFAMASISSARSCCFSWKDIFFSSHSVVISESVFWLSASTPSSAAFCFVSSAFCSVLRFFSLVISSTARSEFSMKSLWSEAAML
mmetsp:Transcript_71539/g.198063  ORF Transcript_71539/g.198063 Transcript_71539/m.198063 type:complete len:215 (+) Transcript_71539:962-1606(+)